MKEQLTELLKKANDGVSAIPAVAKSIIQQYQMAHIGYLIVSTVLMIIFAAILCFVTVAFAKKKAWALDTYHSYGEDTDYPSPLGWILIIISGFLTIAFSLTVLYNIGPAFAPVWYMLKDLMN